MLAIDVRAFEIRLCGSKRDTLICNCSLNAIVNLAASIQRASHKNMCSLLAAKRGTKGKHFYTHISFSSLFATDGDERCKNTFTHMCFCFAKVLLVFALSPANFCALLPNTIHMHVHMYVCVCMLIRPSTRRIFVISVCGMDISS